MDAVSKLKHSAIDNYKILIKLYENGYQPCYEHILEMINLIQDYSKFKNKEWIFERLINQYHGRIK